MIICFSRNFIFVHLHKTAGESIFCACRTVLASGDIAINGGPELAAHEGKVAFLDKHSSAPVLKSFLGEKYWRNTFKFAVVRNPISRAVSLYNWSGMQVERAGLSRSQASHMLDSNDVGNLHFLRWPSVHVWSMSNDFSTFIRHSYLNADRAWMPQVESLRDPLSKELLIDKALKFESLDADWRSLMKHLVLPPLPKVNVSQNRQRSLAVSDVTQHDRTFLFERFKEDFEFFNYDVE